MKLIYLMYFFVLFASITTAAIVRIYENERKEIDSSLSTEDSNEKLSEENASKELFQTQTITRSLVPGRYLHRHPNSRHHHQSRHHQLHRLQSRHHQSHRLQSRHYQPRHHQSRHHHSHHVHLTPSRHSCNPDQNYSQRHIYSQIDNDSLPFHRYHHQGHSSSFHYRPRIPIDITTEKPFQGFIIQSATSAPSQKTERIELQTTTPTPQTKVENSPSSGYYDGNGNFFDIDVRIADD